MHYITKNVKFYNDIKKFYNLYLLIIVPTIQRPLNFDTGYPGTCFYGDFIIVCGLNGIFSLG